MPQIEVSFDIDANGILNVSAVDKGTGRAQSIKIENTGGLSEAEIERMQEEAEAYAEEDERQRQIAGLKNQANILLYNYESTLKNNADLIGEELKADVQQKAEALQEAIANENNQLEDMQEALETFKEGLLAIGSSVYSPEETPAGEESVHSKSEASSSQENS
jgi:molecular chaperone DnaK